MRCNTGFSITNLFQQHKANIHLPSLFQIQTAFLLSANTAFAPNYVLAILLLYTGFSSSFFA